MARPALTSVTQSTWGQPFAGEVSKSVTAQAGLKSFANLPSGVATSDTMVVFADYGVWNNTHDGAMTVESTNFKDDV